VDDDPLHQVGAVGIAVQRGHAGAERTQRTACGDADLLTDEGPKQSVPQNMTSRMADHIGKLECAYGVLHLWLVNEVMTS
jgi:hypothetical protein